MYIDTHIFGDRDTIELKIVSFDTDPNDVTDTRGVPQYFRLHPCDVVAVMINLQEYHFKNRAESPCRNDYPADLKKLLKSRLEPNWLNNAILAPNLPYDQRICDDLCVVNYWLPKCNCWMSEDVWYYVGGAENKSLTLCEEEYESQAEKLRNKDKCVRETSQLRTPVGEFARCQCYKRCDGYSFMVAAYDKYRLNIGAKMFFQFLKIYEPRREMTSILRARHFYEYIRY